MVQRFESNEWKFPLELFQVFLHSNERTNSCGEHAKLADPAQQNSKAVGCSNWEIMSYACKQAGSLAAWMIISMPSMPFKSMHSKSPLCSDQKICAGGTKPLQLMRSEVGCRCSIIIDQGAFFLSCYVSTWPSHWETRVLSRWAKWVSFFLAMSLIFNDGEMIGTIFRMCTCRHISFL